MAKTSSPFASSPPSGVFFALASFSNRRASFSASGAFSHRSSAQSTDLKKGCAFTSSAPPLVPSRSLGSRLSSCRSRSLSSALVAGASGNLRGWLMMLWNVYSRRLARNGVVP